MYPARDSAEVVVGVDIGGSKLLACAVDRRGAIVGRTTSRTPDRSEPAKVVEDAIVDAVARVLPAGGPRAVGLAVAGFVDAAGAMVRFSPHVAWRDEPLRDRIAARTGVPVHLDNDANAALHGEHRFGAAQGVSHVALVALGTGIGGALLLNGQLVRGAGGMAGELGHLALVPDGRPCPCGLRGCWEEYASGRALRRFYAELTGLDVEGPAITALARTGDSAARAAFDEVGTRLGEGLASLVATVDPGLILIGGGVGAAGHLLLEPAQRALSDAVPGAGYRDLPRLVEAELGVDAGTLGAADAAWSLVGTD